jgi:ParB/RepB/Spo0J family partition protein
MRLPKNYSNGSASHALAASRARDQGAVLAEARRAVRAVKVAWLRLDEIDETPEGLNTRQSYDEASINELAQSIQDNGLLQPVCVRPSGERYTLVFGMRRLRATRRAGLEEIPCTIQVADDDRAFLLNAIENLHQRQLTGSERVRAIERLAATNLGVRDISRRTGFAIGTISAWLRLADKPRVLRALDEDRIDIARASRLAAVRDELAIERLLEAASTVDQPTFYRLAQEAARGVRLADSDAAADDARLADAKRKLELVSTVSAVGVVTLREIAALADELLRRAGNDSRTARAMSPRSKSRLG